MEKTHRKKISKKTNKINLNDNRKQKGNKHKTTIQNIYKLKNRKINKK